MIDEALGLRPKRQKTYGDIDQNELKAFLSKGGTERGSEYAERIQGICIVMSTYSSKIIHLYLFYSFLLHYKGLGAAPAKHHKSAERLSSIEKQIIELKGGVIEKPVVDEPISSGNYRNDKDNYVGGTQDFRDRGERDRIEKERKKAEKKERKREKK